MGRRGPSLGTRELPLTPQRIETFLEVLRSSGGVWSAACQAASPGAKGKRACYTTFRNLRRQDRAFDEACTQIIEQCADDLEAELIRRAVSGDENFVFQKGEQVFMADGTPAVHCRKSDALLLAALRAARPGRFGEKKDIRITHQKAGSHWEITAEDFTFLSHEEKQQLGGIIATVQAGRNDTKALTHQPGKTVDVPVVEMEAEFEEVKVLATPSGEDTADVFPPWED